MADKDSDNELKLLREALTNAESQNSRLMNSMVGYLRESGNMPKMEGSLSGNFDGAYYPDDNEIEIRNPKAGVMLHELGHATESAIDKAARNDGQMLDIINRLMGGRFDRNNTMSLLGRTGSQGQITPVTGEGNRQQSQIAHNRYRLNPREQTGWAIQNTNDPTARSGGHLDATRAQEFEILLDVATRRLQKQKESKTTKGKKETKK